MKITGAELFVKALKKEKVDTLFAYPGGQAIDLFDALYGEEDIHVILPRHEQGLIHAADGYARSTGKTGVCLVTSGPGATNLVTGIATANYDSVPLVCFTGQVPTGLIGKHAFQEVDIADITKSICKYAVTVQRREDLAGEIRKAFRIAGTGKPGVAVVDLPKDIQRTYGSDVYPEDPEMGEEIFRAGKGEKFPDPKLEEEVMEPGKGREIPKPETGEALTDTEAGKRVSETEKKERISLITGETDKRLVKAAELLNNANRPLFLLGGGVNISRTNKEMQKLAELTGVPVVTTIMGKGAIPSTHELYVGSIGIHGSYAANTAVGRCDLLLAIGTRFNDRITGKTEEFAKGAAVVHVDIDEACIGRNVAVDVPIVADAGEAIGRLLEMAKPLGREAWREQIREWEHRHPLGGKKDGITPEMIIGNINRIFDDAVVATDVGQNQLWAAQFLDLNEKRQMLTSGGLGTMGYGLPAGIGAQIGNPEKEVVVICGDGGMQMNIQEMATAVVYELPVTICILNNGYLGNVRQWQEMFFDRRYAWTCMRYRKSCMTGCSEPAKDCPAYTPDFVKLAESYGAEGIRVTDEKEIAAALETAKKNRKGPTIIEFVIGREENVMPIVPPGKTLEEMILD